MATKTLTPLNERADASRWRCLAARWRRAAVGWEEIALLVRMAAWFVVLPVLIRLVSLQRLVRWLARPSRRRQRRPRREQRLIQFAAWFDRLTPKSSAGQCLNRGLLLYHMLSREQAQPRLVLGVARAATSVEGHAWVVVDGCAVGESREILSRFAPMLVFGDKGQIVGRGSKETTDLETKVAAVFCH